MPTTITSRPFFEVMYRGYYVADHGQNYHPTTGRFTATRFGVSIGHPTRDGIVAMIDTRINEQKVVE